MPAIKDRAHYERDHPDNSKERRVPGFKDDPVEKCEIVNPTWHGAGLIYCDLLKNPDVSPDTKHKAEQEILRALRILDHLQASEASKE